MKNHSNLISKLSKTFILTFTLLLVTCLQAQKLSNEEKEARNINNQSGYIVNSKGEKIEGIVRMKYFETDPMAASLATSDLRTAVSISYTVVNRKGKEKTRGNTFRPKNVQYFVVFDEDGTENRYEPVSMAMLGNLMSSSALDLDARKPYFQKVIYTNGDYVAYLDPSSENASTQYSVVKKRGTKAILFAELLRNGRTTQSFVGNCPVLQNKLEQKQIPNDKEGIKEFINLLIACCPTKK
jgi:hypothetical protein